MSRVAAEAGDDGTNDVIVNDVVSPERVAGVVRRRAPGQRTARAGGVAWLCSGRVDRPTRLIEPVARLPSSGLTHQRVLACSPRKTKQVERAFATCLPSSPSPSFS